MNQSGDRVDFSLFYGKLWTNLWKDSVVSLYWHSFPVHVFKLWLNILPRANGKWCCCFRELHSLLTPSPPSPPSWSSPLALLPFIHPLLPLAATKSSESSHRPEEKKYKNATFTFTAFAQIAANSGFWQKEEWQRRDTSAVSVSSLLRPGTVDICPRPLPGLHSVLCLRWRRWSFWLGAHVVEPLMYEPP